MALIDPRQVFNAALAALQAGGRRVGDHKAPADRTHPYAVAYYAGGTRDGSMDDGAEDAFVVVSVTGVGVTRDQAQLAVAWARATILGRTNGQWATPIAGPGWTVFHREYDGSAGIDKQENVELYNAYESFRLSVTRA